LRAAPPADGKYTLAGSGAAADNPPWESRSDCGEPAAGGHPARRVTPLL
jgi:hypothetical protein